MEQIVLSQEDITRLVNEGRVIVELEIVDEISGATVKIQYLLLHSRARKRVGDLVALR